MSQKEEDKVHGYLALDIETTGQWHTHMRDVCFAFGYSHGTVDDGIKGSGKTTMFIGKKEDEDWRDLWIRKGYEIRCYDQFWSKNLDILESLQDPKSKDIVASESEMVSELIKILSMMEESYDSFTIMFDTVAFDSVWISNLLVKHGKYGLLYNRDGTYHCDSTLDTDSFARGVCGSLPHVGRKRKRELKSDLNEGFEKEAGDHDPEVDARNILSKFFHVIKKQQKRF